MTDRQQRWFNTALWPNACRAQGWRVTDRPFKLARVSAIIGRDIDTTKDVGWGKEFDILKNELLRLALPDSLAAAERAAENGATEQRDRWLRHVAQYPVNYVASIVGGYSCGRTEDPAELNDKLLECLARTLTERERAGKVQRLAAATDPALTGETPF